MSITKLPTNYIDGVLDGKRKYVMTTNQDNTVSFEDVSSYIRAELNVSADELNNINDTINDLIDLSEDNASRIEDVADDLDDIVSGDLQVGRVTTADYADSVQTANSATTADTADYATTADSATNVTNATNATNAVNATNASEAENASSADSATTVNSVDNDFVISRQTLNFQNNVCTLYDSRITANSIAVVYFTEETAEVAKNADISVSVDTIRVVLTAKNTPTGSIVASIKIRVV